MKILIVNIFGIGDVLFTTPLIRNIKTHRPEAKIGYVANRRTAEVLKSHPDIDKVFVYERDEYQAVYRRSPLRFLKKGWQAVQEIRHEGYDCVIDLSLNGSCSFLMMLAGIPERIGYNYRNRSPFLNKKVRLEGYDGRHVVEYYLDLLGRFGWPAERHPMEFPLREEDRQWAAEFLNKAGVKDRHRVVAVVPGGGASWGRDAAYKRWPADQYASLADKIVENFGVKIILLGDPGEVPLCKRVAAKMTRSVIQAAGQTTIAQCAALLEKCTAAVLNDGGLLHIAVAAGTTTVSIFGPVDEAVYGPYPCEGHRVVTKNVACRPCYRRFRRAACDHISCLSGVTMDDVFKEIKEVLEHERSLY